MTIVEQWRTGDYRIPQSRELLEGLMGEMDANGELTRQRVRNHFGDLIEEIERRLHQRYSQAEEANAQRVLRDYFSAQGLHRAEDVIESVAGHYGQMAELYMSIFQSRKSRAGSAFEDILKQLFIRLNYPFTEQPIINGQPDFVIPSVEHYRRNAMDSIIFTSKRTLRERWRQIVTEGTRGLGFYLATIDDNISQNNLDEMREHRIWVVVPDRIKAECYPDAINAISFATFFNDHLDVGMARWRRNGVI